MRLHPPPSLPGHQLTTNVVEHLGRSVEAPACTCGPTLARPGQDPLPALEYHLQEIIRGARA